MKRAIVYCLLLIPIAGFSQAEFFFAVANAKKAIPRMSFAIAGQSNARMNTLGEEPPVQYQGDYPGVQMISNTGTALLNYPNNTGDGFLFGPELSLATEYKKLYPIGDLYIGKRAVGGSTITETAGNDWNVTTPELSLEFRNILVQLESQRHAGEKIVVYWNQGESETQSLRYNSFVQNFNAMYDYWIATGVQIDLLIIGKLNSSYNAFGQTATNAVRAAQQQIIDTYPNAVGFDMNDYTLGSDGVHYGADAAIQIGERLLQIATDFFI